MSPVELSESEKETTEVGTDRRGEEREEHELHQEQRLARDGNAYTHAEFMAHYSPKEKAQ